MSSTPIPISSPKATDGPPNNQPSPADPNNVFASSPQVGTPDLRQLRARYGGTPPTQPIPPFASSPARSSTATPIPRRPSSAKLAAATPGTPPDPSFDLSDLPDEEKAKVLRRHLVSKQEREEGSKPGTPGTRTGASTPRRPSKPAALDPNAIDSALDDQEPFPIPYDAPGGDITAPIYKWHAGVAGGQPNQPRRRSISYAGPTTPRPHAFAHIHEPGGFRRNYLLLRDQANVLESQQLAGTTNFIEFLYLFGHFAGEDLEEIEEEDEEEVLRAAEEDREIPPFTPVIDEPESEEQPSRGLRARLMSQPSTEESPLLPRPHGSQIFNPANTLRRSMSRRRTRSMSRISGDASTTQAILMLMKGFVGTGILFLGKAFYNGGILFSVFAVSGIALISLYSFLLLTDVKFTIGGSFGDMGGILYGPYLRQAILFSITISQIGFVTAYMIFVSSSLAPVFCLPQYTMLLLQLPILIPIAMIRNLAKLSFTALIADGFILLGLLYIWGSEFGYIARRGIGDVEWLWNSRDYPLLIGTAVFSFEGIGLVIPITDAMRNPRKFPAVLTGVMFFLLFLFTGSGLLSYLTFGSEIQPTVIINLPQDSKLVQTVQVIYSLAILLSIPIQLFPAMRIMENLAFSPSQSGKMDTRVKWEKNAFRFLIVVGCAGIAQLGARDLDKFVSFVGCFACIPLCFIYPALLHMKACAETLRQKIVDWAILIFGVVVMIYSTAQTIKLALGPPETGNPAPGTYCKHG